MGRAKDGASAQLSAQKNRATDGLSSVAQAVRQSTQQLRDQQHDTIAEYVDQAAQQIEQFSNRLRQKDVGELLDDAQRLARRNPGLFIGGAFALGILAARFFKSSRDNSSDRNFGSFDGSTGARYRGYASGGGDRSSTAPSRETTDTADQRRDVPGRGRF
jgi:exonuclease VII large subunit